MVADVSEAIRRIKSTAAPRNTKRLKLHPVRQLRLLRELRLTPSASAGSTRSSSGSRHTRSISVASLCGEPLGLAGFYRILTAR